VEKPELNGCGCVCFVLPPEQPLSLGSNLDSGGSFGCGFG
jgi:hypothetical protein